MTKRIVFQPEQRYRLLWVPLAAYSLAYIYLAVYHGKWWLFPVKIHESGDYTLTQTILYASHFLGHIPVLVILGCMFYGIYAAVTPAVSTGIVRKDWRWPLGGVVFLTIAVSLSLALFGGPDTWMYIQQYKQSRIVQIQGGSWLLHLPSTMMYIVGIPLYMISMHLLFGIRIRRQPRGMICWLFGICGIIPLTIFATREWAFWETIRMVWTDPRYLAHSVRELMTFPLMMFPFPLVILYGRQSGRIDNGWGALPGRKFWIALAALFLALLAYQSIVPLVKGIGELAQKPSFAHGGQLSIAYLLASHMFEHFLDSIFFFFFVLSLDAWMRRNPMAMGDE